MLKGEMWLPVVVSVAQSNTKLLVRSSLRVTAIALCVVKLLVRLLLHGHMSRSITSDGYEVKPNWANINRPRRLHVLSAKCVVPRCSMLLSRRFNMPSAKRWVQ